MKQAKSDARVWANMVSSAAEKMGFAVSTKIEVTTTGAIRVRVDATASVIFENDADCALFKLKYGI